MKMLLLLIFCLFSLSVQAAGTLIITTEPQETKIYIDGELKGVKSPLVLSLEAGSHNVLIDDGLSDMETIIVIRDNELSKRGFVLSSVFREGKPRELSINELLNPQPHQFETEVQFKLRKLEYLEKYRQGVTQRDPAFRAGLAMLLNKTNSPSANWFSVVLSWEDWAKEFGFQQQGSVMIADAEDVKNWLGQQVPVFLTLEPQAFLVGSKETWPLEIPRQIDHYLAYDNGTVLDTRTGLMWMRCTLGQMWVESRCQSNNSSEDFMTWQEAKAHQPFFAGYSDWRIPSSDELLSLIACKKPDFPDKYQYGLSVCTTKPHPNRQHVYIHAEVFPHEKELSGFWTNTLPTLGFLVGGEHAELKYDRYIVDFLYVRKVLSSADKLHRVRLVREVSQAVLEETEQAKR